MHHNGGPIYHIPIAASALTTVQPYDLFQLIASSSARFELLGIKLALASTQYTTHPALGLKLYSGSTGVSTAVAITPVNIKRWTGAPTAALTASGPCTGVISTTSATVLYADAFDARGIFEYEPECDRLPVLALSQSLHLLSTTPSIAATLYGTITVRETGKGLPS